MGRDFNHFLFEKSLYDEFSPTAAPRVAIAPFAVAGPKTVAGKADVLAHDENVFIVMLSVLLRDLSSKVAPAPLGMSRSALRRGLYSFIHSL